MLEVESVTQVKKSRRKHDRSQSANTPVKDIHAEYIEDYNLKTKSKTSKHLKETQDKLAKLEIADDFNKGQSAENLEKTKKKKRRRRPQSADQLNDDRASIRKDPTLAEQNLIHANLYKNDKNKSLEKETKQSYSEALSGWSQDEITDDHQYKSRKTDNEQKDRRVRKKTNLDHKEVAAAVETAVNVEKVRKRIKKRTKQRETTDDPVDHRDAIDGHEGTQKESRNNLGYESGECEDTVEHREGGKTKSKSKARENLGYVDEVETGETSREPKPEKLKSGKRRRKKLKEASADVIHRALERKRKDDGHVMCIVIHKADRLKTDLRINHPLVRVHVVDVNTGEYVKKCSRNRAATSYYENQETVNHILPLMTQPFDFKQRKSLIPSWEDVLIINEIYSYFLLRNEGDPNVIIFFEILDFLSMTAINKLKGSQRSDRGWYQIAWAFLKLVGSNGSPNTDTKIRLQLFYPMKSNRRRQLLNPNIPEVYHWWSSPSRLPYPSTLYVSVKGIKPPKDIDAAGRSMFAVQEEKGKMTFEELTGKIGRGESPSELDPNHDIVTWTKLPGQPNHVPNQIMSTLQVGRRGCFVVRFSNDGRKLACGCAEKHSFSIFIFETLSGRNISKFQGHFSIIYDLCWSHNDKELLSASSDGTARSWEVSRDGSSATKTYPHPCFVYAARYHPQRQNIVITGGYDRLVRIWRNDSEGVNGQLLREMDGHSGFINTICFDLAGQYMFSGDSSGTVIVWNTYESIETKSGKRRTKSAADVQRWVISKTVQDPEIKDCIINSIQLHPNGRKLLVHTRDSVTRMLDLRSFTMMTRYIGANNFREHVRSTMTTCGSFVFSGSEDGLVHVWDTETGNVVKVYNDLSYTAAVSDIDFHPHDDIVAFCSFGQNHPVILYQFNHSGTVNETPHTPAIPPVSPLRATTRTLGQTTEQLLTTEPRTVERTTHMADVASETLLLNKIKKKLDSVLEVSNTTAGLRSSMAGSRTFQRTPSPNSLLPDTLFEQRDLRTLSTWGSDFSTLPTTPYSPGSHPQSPQRGFGTQTLSQFETGQLGGSHFLSASQEQLTYSRPQSRRDSVALFTVKAAYPFAARNADELNLDEGDVIKVLRQEDEHWWVGEMEDGRQGYFPASYTIMIDQTKKKKVEKHAEKKQYTAVKTAEGDVKILSAPEESDVDDVVKKRSRVDGRPPRHTRDKSRPSSTIGKKSPRRTKNVRDESNA